MHLTLVSHKLGSCQGQPRGDNPLNGGIVGKIEEETDVLHASVLLKVLLEEPGSLHVYPHGGEDDSKVVLEIIRVNVRLFIAKQKEKTEEINPNNLTKRKCSTKKNKSVGKIIKQTKSGISNSQQRVKTSKQW